MFQIIYLTNRTHCEWLMYFLLKVLRYELSFDKSNCKLEIKSFSE